MAIQYWTGASLQIEECIFSQLFIEAERPFSIHSNAWGRTAGKVSRQIRGITFSQIRGTVSVGNLIDAYEPGDIRDLCFDRIALRWTGKAPGTVWEEPGYDFTERTRSRPAGGLVHSQRGADRAAQLHGLPGGGRGGDSGGAPPHFRRMRRGRNGCETEPDAAGSREWCENGIPFRTGGYACCPGNSQKRGAI